MSNKKEVLRKIIEDDYKLNLGDEELIDRDRCLFTVDDLILKPIDYGIRVYNNDKKEEKISICAGIKYIMEDMFVFTISYKNGRSGKYYLFTEFAKRLSKLRLISPDFNDIYSNFICNKTKFQHDDYNGIFYPKTIVEMFNGVTGYDTAILIKNTVRYIIRKSYPSIEGIDKDKHEKFIRRLTDESVCEKFKIEYNEAEKILFINENVIKEFLSIPNYYFNKHFKSHGEFIDMVYLLSTDNVECISDNFLFANVVINK